MEPHDRSFALKALEAQTSLLFTAIRLHDGKSVTPAHLITREAALPDLVKQPGRLSGYSFLKDIPVKHANCMTKWALQDPIIHHPKRTQLALYKYHRSFSQINTHHEDQWAWCPAIDTFDVPLLDMDDSSSAETRSEQAVSLTKLDYDARSPGPPPQKKAKNVSVHRPPLFPEPMLSGSLNQLPQELLYIIFKGLDLASLVALGAVSRRLRSFLSDDTSLRRDIWQPAREAYKRVPLCPPNLIMNSAWGISVTELQWATWALGGGNCAYCGQYTRQSRASYALNIHVCLKTPCRLQWDTEKDDLTTTNLTTTKLGHNSDTTTADPLPDAVLSATVERRADNVVATDLAIEKEIVALYEADKAKLAANTALIPLYPVAEQIRAFETLNTYIKSSATVSDLIRQRAPDEQAFVLCAMLKEEGKLELSIGRQAKGLRDYALGRLKKRKGLNCKFTYPRLLSQIDTFSWPDRHLKAYVSDGLAFVESGPTHTQRRSDDGLTIVNCYSPKKYKVSDFKAIARQWQESVTTNARTEFIAMWEECARLLVPRIQCAEQVMNWRDERKTTFEQIRKQNDIFLQQQIETMKLVWEDANHAPTFARVKTLSQLAQDALSEKSQLWIQNKNVIRAETEQVAKRRLELDGSRLGSSVVDALYELCEEQGLGPLPPLKVFETLPTPMLCPATSAEVRGTLMQRIPQITKELEEWQEAAKAVLRCRALEGYSNSLHAEYDAPPAALLTCDVLDILDEASSLFCCDTCDAVAEGRAKAVTDHARRQFKEGKAKKERTRDVKPRYDAPMTWQAVLAHRCPNWDLNSIRMHEGAKAITIKACETMGRSPKATRTEDLVRLGKAWTCEYQGCIAPDLDWRDMVCHLERHDEEKHQSRSASGSITRLFRKRREFAPSANAADSPTNVGLEAFTSPVFQDMKTFQCARCSPPKTAGTKKQKFTPAGLKSHLGAKHKIFDVQDADITFIGDLPIPVSPPSVSTPSSATSLPFRVPEERVGLFSRRPFTAPVPEHRCICRVLKAMP